MNFFGIWNFISFHRTNLFLDSHLGISVMRVVAYNMSHKVHKVIAGICNLIHELMVYVSSV